MKQTYIPHTAHSGMKWAAIAGLALSVGALAAFAWAGKEPPAELHRVFEICAAAWAGLQLSPERRDSGRDEPPGD